MMKKFMTLTDAAAEQLKIIMARDHEGATGVRVGVKRGGCTGLTYYMEYAKEARKYEEVVEDQDVRLFIDPAASFYLLGTVMDYVQEGFARKFVFINPNEKGRCGCGISFHV